MENTEDGTVVEAGLSPQALDALRSLDSLSYGLLDLQSKAQPNSGGIGGVAGRESPPVTRHIIQQGVSHLRGSVSKFSHSPHTQAQIVSLIAHLHLLLDEFTHAYSAYSQYRRLSPASESDPALFYGLGIIHRRHGQHKHSEESYRKVLSLAPSFPRSGEVHLQLGLLLKRKRSYGEAVAHLERALSKPDPHQDKLLTQFHLANVWELHGQTAEARRAYEALLNCRTLSTGLKTLTQKQLGWLLHRWPEEGGEGEKGRALELLREASRGKPDCGETWYLLGRVLMTHRKCHEAFAAYQKAIHYPSKVSPANTWHSIGHLYFQMQQPRDCLQAYLCCVYIDVFHLQGWKSLGCLYEAVVYPREALICYQNAMTAFAKKGVRMGKDVDYVRSRIDSLNRYLSVVGVKLFAQNSGMPLLHEAWATLVPLHIRKKQPKPETPLLTLNESQYLVNTNLSGPLSYSLPPPTYPSPSPTSLLTPSTPGSTNTSGVTGNVNFRTPPSSENANSRLQSGGSSLGALESNQNGGTAVKGGDLDFSGINLENLDFEALAAAATSSLPSPASLSARSRVTVTSTCRSEQTPTVNPQVGTSLSPSLLNSGPPASNTSFSSLQPSLGAQPCSLALTPTLSSPYVPLCGSSTSLSSPFLSPYSTSHTTDTVWSQQNAANWPSYLMKQGDTSALKNSLPLQSLPNLPQHATVPPSLSLQKLSSAAQSHHWSSPTVPPPPYSSVSSALPPPCSSPPSSAPARSLQLTGEREKSAPRKRRSNPSSTSKARNRRSSQTNNVCSSQPTPLLAEQPFLAGFSGIKKESNVGFPAPIPSNMASDPSLLSRIRSASKSAFSSTSFQSPELFSTGLNHSTSYQMSVGGSTNVAGFDQVLSQLASPLSGPSFGGAGATEVSQTVPLWTTVANTTGIVDPLFRQTHTTPLLSRTDINMAPSNNAIHISKVANNNGFFGSVQTEPLPTTARPNSSPLGQNQTTPQAWNPTGTLTEPGQEQRVLKKPRLSPDKRRRELRTSSTSLSSELQTSAVPVTQSELAQNLIHDREDHRLHLTESTSSQSSSLPPSSSRQLAPTSFSLVNQLIEALQQKQTSSGGGGGDISPSESSSGVSSAGTNSSAFFPTSTAESSPVDSRSLPTPSAPVSPTLVPSLPRSLPRDHPTTTLPRHSHSGTTNRPQSSPHGSLPRGGPDQNPTNPELKNNIQGALENKSASNNSKLIYPRVPFPSLASLKEYMVLEPDLRPPKQPPFQSGMELRPDCPVYEVTGCEEAEWGRLLEFCSNPDNPISIIRGLVDAIGLDLNLFSSRCLVETCADHEMEVREQMKQAADENCDVGSGRQIWKCESSKSVTTVAEYARYQQNMLQKEREGGEARGTGSSDEREFISFGTNVDISDETIWSHQLQELNKLPQFLRVTCPETNLLSHISHTVLGMNSVQLYMKVAGSRTPGHQENNNFCSLNINVGPGTCEWFAVPNSYWGVLHNLCEKHKVNFLIGSWWPVLEELHQHKVPVYRFTQYRGEVVFINPGTIHWVQANSVCNNIAWNTGPPTAHQFRMAWERYQWNKLQKVRSIIPMVHLTWNMARRIRLNDSHFYWQVRSLLESSLTQTNLLVSHLKKAGIPILWHGRLAGEPAPYCSNCAVSSDL
jgi:tetratricopeptide (TPR) repeat protein